MPRARQRVRPLYTGLRVRHLDRSTRFYRALGFRQTLRLKTKLGRAVQLEHPANRFTIELNEFRRGGPVWEKYRRGSEMDHFGFWVSDVDSTVRKLCQVGGKVKWAPANCSIVIPPHPWRRGRAAMVTDPDGIWIELMGPERGSPRSN